MKRLLGVERIGNRIQRDWMHWGDDGRKKITTTVVEDVEPVFEQVRQMADANRGNRDFRYKASIPMTVIDDMANKLAPKWNLRPREVYQELISSKTDRAKSIWRMLCSDREYRKFQAR